MYYQNNYCINRQQTKDLLLATAFNGYSYAQNLYNIIHQGFEEYLDENQERFHKLNPISRAAVLNSLIQHHAKQFAFNDTNAQWQVKKRMGVLVLFNKIIIRFKKLPYKNRYRNRFKSSNIPTKQVREFRNQELSFGDTGMDCVRLDGGFMTNSLGRAIEETILICPAGDFTNWVLFPSDVTIDKSQPVIFNPEEEEVLPVLAIKPHLIRKSNDQQTGS